MGYETWTDPIVSWIGAWGVGSYLLHVHRRRTRSGLERRILLLLWCLTALFLIRGVYWATDDVRLQVPAFVPATLLPLAVTLFVEGLLRRHLSPALKVFVAAGTLAVFTLNLTSVLSRDDLFTAYTVFALATFFWLGVVLLTRNRRSHSPMENRLIDGTAAALGLTFGVALTDLQIQPDWLPFRVGSVGGLFFVYVCLRWTESGGAPRWFAAEVLWMVAVAAAVTGALAVLVGEAPRDFYVATFSVVVAFAFLLGIRERRRAEELLHRDTSLFRWLALARTGSLEEFLDSLNQLPLAEESLVLRGSELEGYGAETMAQTLSEDEPVRTLSGLRDEARDKDSADGAEQLVSLLKEHGMTHVTLLSDRPPTFLLLALPDFAGAQDPMLQVALLRKYASLLPPAVAAPSGRSS